jgi:hypothetical protein
VAAGFDQVRLGDRLRERTTAQAIRLFVITNPKTLTEEDAEVSLIESNGLAAIDTQSPSCHYHANMTTNVRNTETPHGQEPA